jgi:hypothetical protein
MPRLAAPMLPLVALLAPLAGCPCNAKRPPLADAGPDAAPLAVRTVSAPSEAAFSAPIAATMAGHEQVVAGLVASDQRIRVRGMRGRDTLWCTDVLQGAAWAPDVDLRLLPGPAGVAVVWGGPAASGARTLVVLGLRGDVVGEPISIGAAVCASADGVAWVDPRRSGPVRIRARAWGGAEVRDGGSLPADRDAALVCGDHAVFVLGDGDDDLTVSAFVPGEGVMSPGRVAMRDADFGDDDEREHDAYTLGDTLGLVRVAASGAIAMREVPRSGSPTAWRTLKQRLSPDDDVVAVDGDATTTLVLFTHDVEDACPGPGSSAEAIRALRIDRASGAESLVDLAPPSCDVSPGPFWIAQVRGGQVAAWVERSGKVAPNAPPIRRLAARTVRPDGVLVAGADLDADALVDGGCDDAGCFAAALVRPPGGDGTRPEAIAVVGYP